MPHLVDGDVEPLVVHAALLDARAQVGLEALLAGAEGVSRASRGVDLDVCGDLGRLLFRKAELLEKIRDVLGVGLRRRVSLPDDRVELSFRIRQARLEARVPDIEGLELAAEPLFDQFRHLRNERRGEDVLEHLAHARLGDLPSLVEAARDVGRAPSASTDRPGARPGSPREASRNACPPPVRRAALRRARASRTSESLTPAGLTSLLNGFQSTPGLLMTACGIVWVTMRSMTFWTVRCLASPAADPRSRP